MFVYTPELSTEDDARRHFEELATAIERGANYLDSEAVDAAAAADPERAQAKRRGADAARRYATHVKTEWHGQNWVSLSEDAQMYARACELNGILMDPITSITREEEQAAKGYSPLSGPQIDVAAARATRAIYMRLVDAGRFVHIDETINDVKQLPFFAIAGYYPATH